MHVQALMMSAIPASAPPSDTSFFISLLHTTGVRTYPGAVGYKITLGGTSVTVTQLGRWCSTGNSQTQSLQIRDAGGTVVASVTVNSALGTPGAFLYGTLGTPYVLSASTSYWITSDESNGDVFPDVYGASAQWTHTGISTYVAAAYDAGGMIDTGQLDASYGLMDFKYH